MRSNFPYLYGYQSQADIQITDIGNCIIEANNDLNEQYYLFIKTNYGITRIIEYGPHSIIQPLKCSCIFLQISYNENRIVKIIDKFLNNSSYCITQARELAEIDDILKNIINPIEYYNS